MKRVSLLVLALAPFAGCGDDDGSTTSSAADPITPVAGTWEGTLHQRDTRPFPIEVSITSSSDPEANIVNYGGSIDCSGTWSYRATEGVRVEFEEVIDSGEGGSCKGRGSVTVTPDGSELDYEFRGGGVRSEGVLREASAEK
jgi:hypothetical protein